MKNLHLCWTDPFLLYCDQPGPGDKDHHEWECWDWSGCFAFCCYQAALLASRVIKP